MRPSIAPTLSALSQTRCWSATIDDFEDVPHRREEIELDEREWAGAVITPAADNSRIRVELYDSEAQLDISAPTNPISHLTHLWHPPIFLNTMRTN